VQRWSLKKGSRFGNLKKQRISESLKNGKLAGLTSRARWFLVPYIALRMPHCELLRGVITKL